MAKKFKSLIDKNFTNLTVIEHNNLGTCICKCKCGERLVVATYRLRSKHTKSCGCLKYKHGFWNTEYSKGKMKFYKMWQSLKARCDNSNLKCYKNYGGRGIIYDPRWKDFEAFREDMYMKYLYTIKQKKIKDLSIERENVNGNYNRENCTFVSRPDQLKNLRSIIIFIAISPKGEKSIEKNVKEFSDKYGLNSSHVYECLDKKANHHKGWTFKKR